MRIKQKIQKLFLSLFGVGYIRFAPGTWGSLLSGFILFSLAQTTHASSLHVYFWGLLFCGTFWISLKFIQKENHPYDYSWIVIDEFLGIMVTLLPLFVIEKNIWYWGVGFILFRIFDIWKPFGIRKIDNLKTPLSVILDDIVAGIYVGIILLTTILLSSFFSF